MNLITFKLCLILIFDLLKSYSDAKTIFQFEPQSSKQIRKALSLLHQSVESNFQQGF